MKKIFYSLIFLLFSIVIFSVYTGCANRKNNIDGTYYEFKNEVLDKSSYFIFKGGEWTDDDNLSGEYEVDGNKIILYINLFDSKEELCSGLIEKGKFEYELLGERYIYYKEGYEPENSNTKPSENESYTIDFNNNGHGESLNQVTGVTKIPTSLPKLTENGYIFEGWYLDSSCRVKAQEGKEITDNITLYAKWSKVVENSYTITYENKGLGKKPVDSINVTKIPTSLPELIENGYIFEGWYLDSLCSVKAQEGKEITGNITLYAKWSRNQGLLISFEGACINGDKIDLFVENDIEYVSLLNKISVVKNANWRLFYDKLGQIEIPTKIATSMSGKLVDGDNYFYIVITLDDQTELYELNIYKSYEVDIVYKRGTQILYTDKAYTGLPYELNYVPLIPGFTFNYWMLDGQKIESIQLKSPLEISANVTANKYEISLDVNGGNDISKTKYDMVFGEKYHLPTPVRTGYTFIGWKYNDIVLTNEEGDSLDTYNFDENINLKAEWEINKYIVSCVVDDYGTGTVTASGSYEFGSEASICAIPNAGFYFVGWFLDDELVSEKSNYTFKIPDKNLSFKAVFQVRNDVPYAIKHYQQNIDNSNYTLFETDYLVGETNTMTNGTAKVYEGFNTPNINQVKIKGDGTTVIELYYTRNKYNITLNANESAAGVYSGSGTFAYGKNITITATSSKGYTWLGWYEGDELVSDDIEYKMTMPAKNVIYTAKWTYYTLTINQTIGGTVTNNLFEQNIGAVNPTIVYDYNNGQGIYLTEKLGVNSKLSYPEIPVYSNHVFRGWFVDPECTKVFDFSSVVYDDLVLYAGWQKMYTEKVNSNAIIDATKYTSSYDYARILYHDTSTLFYNYRYFTCYTGGTKHIYYKNYTDEIDYTIHLYIYNMTQDKVILAEKNVSNTNFSSVRFEANAGDVICIRGWEKTIKVNNYSNSSPLYCYFANISYPMDGGEIANPTKVEKDKEITLTANTNVGYTWLGWYKQDEFISNSLAYTFNKKDENEIYEARWAKVTLKTNDDLYGNVEGLNSTYLVGDKVIITAITNPGYTFVGWYEGDKLLTDEETYTFEIPSYNVTYEARWSKGVTVRSEDVLKGTVSELTGTYLPNDEVTITAITNSGYTFIGWYKGDELLSGELEYTFTMPSEPVIYEARWSKVTVQSESILKGTVSELTGTYLPNDEVTITATTNPGYTFVGWYNDDELLGGELSYTFNMPSINVTYEARWSKVTVQSESISKGTVSELTGTYLPNDEVTITATTNPGYTFVGWYEGDELLSGELEYTFTMLSESVIYEARFGLVEFNINYVLNGGINNESNPNTFTIEDEIVLLNPTKDFYDFVGWGLTDNEINLIDKINKGRHENLVLYAIWQPINYSITYELDGGTNNSLNPSSYTFEDELFLANPTKMGYIFIGWTSEYTIVPTIGMKIKESSGDLYIIANWSKLTLISNNNAAGIVSTLNKTYLPGDEVTITATTNPGYTFIGWYDDETRLSTSLSYTFEMPSINKTYEARWIKVTVQSSDISRGIVSTLNKTYLPGDEATITATTNPGYTFIGWYDDETRLSTSLSYTFEMPSINKTYEARWIKVTVQSSDTSRGTVSELTGTYLIGYPVSIDATTLDDDYIFSGWYDGDNRVTIGTSYTVWMPSEDKTYTAKWITVNLENGDTTKGSVSYSISGYSQKYVDLKAVPILGYIFDGWYKDDELVSVDPSYKIEVSVNDLNFSVKWRIAEEMSNFEFTSTSTTCVITKIKNKNIRKIEVPNYVTDIEQGCFYGCSQLSEISIHFTKNMLDFRELFTPQNQTITATYVPRTLTTVNVNKGESNFIFKDCKYIKTLILNEGVYSVGDIAGCTALSTFEAKSIQVLPASVFEGFSLTSITLPACLKSAAIGAFFKSSISSLYYEGTIDDWCGINFGAYSSVPMPTKFYMRNQNGEWEVVTKINISNKFAKIGSTADGGGTIFGCFKDLKELTISEGVTHIQRHAFSGCSSLENVTLPKSVTNIVTWAFRGCSSLENVYYNGTIEDWCKISFEDYSSNPMHYASHFYMLNNNEYYEPKEFEIPNTIKSIGSYQFNGFGNLISITLPNSITNINEEAFYNCSSLVNINIPSEVTSIESKAFYNCSSLKEIKIPNKVINIGSGVFGKCASLEKITIPFVGMEMDPFVKYPFGVIFGTENYIGGVAAIQEYKRVSDIKIYYSTYYIPATLKEVIITKSNYIYYGAFSNCRTIRSIQIPESVVSIDASAFNNCSSLENITIPNRVTSIGEDAFSNCNSLENVYYTGTIEDWCKIVFANLLSNPMCNASHFNRLNESNEYYEVTEIEIPTTITSIGDYQFYDFNNVSSVIITKRVTSIGRWAFFGCENLFEVYNLSNLSIELKDSSNGYIGYYAKVIHTSLNEESIMINKDDYTFMYYNNEYYLLSYNGTNTNITLPNEINGHTYKIYDKAFYNCRSLESITIPDGVTSIGDQSFASCSSLTNIIIGDNVESIGGLAFFGCYSLKSIIIPSSVTNIGQLAFACNKLVEIYNLSNLNIEVGSADNGYIGYYAKTIHSSLDEESIIINKGDYSFIYWNDEYYLLSYNGTDTNITLPKDINGCIYKIYDYAFSNCKYLENIIIPDTVTTIGSYAFYGCTSLISITLPNSITNIGERAFEYCRLLGSITIPNGMTKIESGLFRNCSSLNSIIVPNSIVSISDYVFFECSSLEKVYYEGTSSQWGKISIGKENNILSSETIHYYLDTPPTKSGNYWHYDADGNPVVW